MSSDFLENTLKEEDTIHLSSINISNYLEILNLCRLYIYGGHDIREGSLANLWMLDLGKLIDLEKPEEDQRKECMWHKIDTSGKGPGAVSHHSSVVYGDKMYLFGGSKENGEENPHLFSLDLKSYKWELQHTVKFGLV